jgi:hypothetical protein
VTTEELRRLLDAATPGPWHIHKDNLEDLVCSPSGTLIAETQLRIPEDAALIIAAVNALPALLAVVEAAHDWRNAYESNDPSNDTFEAMNAALDALREAQQ